MPGRVAEVGLGAGGQEPAQHLVGGPLHGRDRRDAEPLVDLGAAGVVDPGDDLLDAEGLARDPRGDDVGVVAAGDGGEGVGAADAGLLQDRLVEAVAGDLVAVEAPGPGVGTRPGSLSMTDTVWLRSSRLRASVEPTRPQPMITTCTVARYPLPTACPCTVATRVSSACRSWVSAMSPSGSCWAASCAAPSWARPCCPSASRCPSSPATRSRRWPTHRTRSSSCCRWRARRRTSGRWKIGIAVALVMAAVVASYRQNVHAYPSRRRRLRGRDRQPRPQRRASRWPARCSSTTCSPWRCRSRRARSTPRRRSPRSAATRRRRRRRWCCCSMAMNLRGVRESGHVLRDPDLRLHGRASSACAPTGCCAAARRRPAARSRAPTSRSSRRPATSDALTTIGADRSCWPGRSRRAVRR